MESSSITDIRRTGVMLVLSSPSGAGKSSIARSLLDNVQGFELSISVTTRQRRPSEIAGMHYHFKTIREFEILRESGELLEWAEVHGNFYGTLRKPVEEAIVAGRDMLFDIDWQGAAQLRKAMPEDVVSIFILPPTMNELLARLKRRAEDPEDVIATRLKNARFEIEQWRDYDYVVINEDLDQAFQSVNAIVEAERLRRQRRPGLEDFVARLLSETPE
ncbi:guanylate kinase [Chelativorans sp. Marseille-P2723]|uniref:guanylate kinase n=1 Tax=Chelativorans sp. Marseille-P2723 TaxID=2709133 RepID=UPI00157071F1|nr:guanylate kinase [Chelativorans sp. Marseille-P2723]